MFTHDFSVYLGQEQEGFVGFVSENKLFVVLKSNEGLTKEEGREVLKKIEADLDKNPVASLAEFETRLSKIWQEHNLPASFSFCGAILVDGILYLKTVGEGVIYVRRGGRLAKLIEGNNSASGYVEDGDLLVFTLTEFVKVLGGEEGFGKLLKDKTPHEALEEITPHAKAQADAGLIALFVSFAKASQVEEEAVMVAAEESTLPQRTPSFKNLQNNFSANLSRFKTQIDSYGKKKTLTFIGVFLVFLVLIWSVVLGSNRRMFASDQKKIQVAKELITEKLLQAEDVVFLNQARAVALINEAKEDLSQLKKEVGDKNNKEIAQLEKLISEKEGEILKKEQKKFAEYFDLSVENRNATGTKMFLDGDTVAILDPQGLVYLVSLEKKSLEKRTSSKIKGGTLIVSNQGDVFVYKKSEGFIRITPDEKTSTAVPNDSQWSALVDVISFNGNLYVLDKGKNDIYKYVAAEEGFSQKSSYFKSQKPESPNANSLAIDASVYVGYPDRILKYTAGEPDQFTTELPQEQSSVTKVITNADLDKVFAWDKALGSVYILAKTGTYERQIDSSILAKASDVVVFDQALFALVGSKIYKIDVN